MVQALQMSPEQIMRAYLAMNPQLRTADPAALQRAMRQGQLAYRLRGASVAQPPPRQDFAPNPLPPAGDPYGLGYAQGPEIDARVGAVPGRMIIVRSGTTTIASTDNPGKAIAQTSAFTQANQDALGSGRRMEGILASCSVAGTFPSGYDAATLIQLALGMLVIKINVNDQLQDTIPFAAATDTRFNERYLRTNVRFDSGAFGAVSLGFDSLGELMPQPASSNYVLTVRAQCIFTPLSRRQRALQSQY